MVKYLEYKGEQLPVRISYYALKKLKETTKKDITKIGADDYDTYEALLFYALKKGHEIEGKPFNLTLNQMEDVMDEVFTDFMKMIPEFFGKLDSTKNVENVPERLEVSKEELEKK